jgi:beta-galactosidase GanA
MLGVCYYPEHWPEDWWVEDARRMRELGIAYVRIGEFAWSHYEPRRADFAWGWLDRALETLGSAGLKIVLGTPTAAPPKWLMDEFPEIAPIDEQGRPRGFGSRRHYTFSSQAYWRESARIIEALAQRYGRYPALVGWQTDNEYGCHNTVLSWGAEYLKAFRLWLRRNYQTPERLNKAWGSAFWSMEVRSFDEVALPNLTVTEPNPAARLDYWRFQSQQVAAYDRMQCEIIRRHSPGRWITHNFMGFFNDFDHWHVGDHLDFAAWDSYPIGFAEHFPFSDPERHSPGGREAGAAADDLARLGNLPASAPAQVAIVYDYEAHWVTAIQPQGADFRYSELVFRWYEAIRRLGLDVDFVPPGATLESYRLVLVPSLPIVPVSAEAAFAAAAGIVVFGPRSGSKTRHFSIPEELPPGPLQRLLNTRVTEVSSLRPGALIEISGAICGHAERWREQVETRAETLATFGDGAPARVAKDNCHYLACWPNVSALGMLMALLCRKAGLATIELPAEVRLRRRGDLTFAFNYGETPWRAPFRDEPLLGGLEVMPRNFSVWRR